jgi:hypothetical protein
MFFKNHLLYKITGTKFLPQPDPSEAHYILGLAVIGDALGLAVGDALGTVGMYEQSWNAFQLKPALQHTTTVGNAVSHESLLLLPHGCSPTQSATHLHLYLSKEKVDKRFRNAFYE